MWYAAAFVGGVIVGFILTVVFAALCFNGGFHD
jgi:hypothetical protein